MNETDGALELCRAGADGRLRCALRVEGHTNGTLTKTEKDGGQFFVLRVARTRSIRAAFGVKTVSRSVEVGPNYICFSRVDWNYANKGAVLWAVRAAVTSGRLPLTVQNNYVY